MPSTDISVANQRRMFGILLLLFSCCLIWNAWIIDDAYITFRTIDNAINGYGLRWNIAERVQVYTHPLWMLVVTSFVFVTREFFFTAIALNLACSMAAVVIAAKTVARNNPDAWKSSLLLLALLCSKAFVDYTTSGLENALGYCLASIFMYFYLRGKQGIFPLFFIASLSFINRNDSLLVFMPALAHLFFSDSTPLVKRSASGLLAISPALLWLLFSLLYYGFPFPNTAYAKLFSNAIPMDWKWMRGIEYLFATLINDTASIVIFIAAMVLSIRHYIIHKSVAPLMLAGGALLYVGYVIASAASATHMGGRFFALPFFVVIVVWVLLVEKPRTGFVAGLLLLLFMAWNPVAAIKFGTPLYHKFPQNRNAIDTKWYALRQGAALIDWRPGKRMPDHHWYTYGEEIRQKNIPVHVGGAYGEEAIGYTGFAAGPDVFIVDRVALSDPLLARLPAIKPAKIAEWKSGHFRRKIPEGYIDSLPDGENLIGEPHLREYYNHLLVLTRAPLFSAQRLGEIWRFNSGYYDGLVQSYTEATSTEKTTTRHTD